MDALSQAAMQKTLASALASTSKSMKRDAKALASGVGHDDARGACMASDLNLCDFAANGNGYEDEDELIQSSTPWSQRESPVPPRRRRACRAQAEAARRLELKHEQWEAAEAVRARMPEAPSHDNGRAKTTERAGLLEQGV